MSSQEPGIGDVMTPDVMDAADAVLEPMNEAELSRWKADLGSRILRGSGRWWEERPRGFFHSLHWMARHSRDEASKPTRLCWGFRASLRDEDAALANAATPVHLISDLANYDLSALASRQRAKIRSCRKQVRLVAYRSAAPLRDQGYAVLSSKLRRVPYRPVPSAPAYAQSLEAWFRPGVLILGGLLDQRLLGYLVAFAVGKTAYIDSLDISTEALPTNVGSALIFEAAQAARRSGRIGELAHGLEIRENPELTQYKNHMRFTVVSVPSKVWIAPGLEGYLRRSRPHLYYRLTGR